MLRCVRNCFVIATVVAGMGLYSASLYAGTIIKLSLGSDAPADIEFDGATLSTVDDMTPLSPGDQDTAIDYQDFLGGMTDVLLPTASFSLNGLTAAPSATVFGGFLVIQDFTGGTFDLYDTGPGYGLLLSGLLANSTLTAPVGPPAAGGLFTTSFASVTGGSLAPLLDPTMLTLSMNLASINNGSGLSVTGLIGPGPVVYKLDAFRADASMLITADPAVPEPATIGLWMVGAVLAGASVRRSRR